ncbi:MAG TPA: DNA repair protein RecN [Pyrinomonadaceae bacterium]|jgi:DNA repair protein RecN (Recombination protein N)|nr:DNA repair protein RecN [Pyrinomonadaceae bacterium]
MLKSLNISNFAVIRYLSIEFHQGFNVLTGETGAGKSIIVDALSLLLGGRAFADVVRTGEKVALVEGIFELDESNERRVKSELSDLAIEIADDEYLTIRREVQPGGRNRIFINDRSVTLSTLKKLQPFLVEIHGQGEQRSLLSPHAHLLLLDSYGGCDDLRRQIAVKYGRWRKMVEELNAMIRDKTQREKLLDILKFQVAEIENLNPQHGEEERLLEEKKLLTYSEQLNELNSGAYNQLYESEQSVLTMLGSVRRTLQALEGIDKRFSPLLNALEEATLSLTDVADTLRTYAARIEYSPARLSEIEERMSEFARLKRKYGRGNNDLNEIREDLYRQLDQLTNWEEHQGELLADLEVLRGEYRVLAGELTACRQAATLDFEKRVMEDLRQVAMESARFRVVIDTAKEEADATSDGQLRPLNEVEEDADFTPTSSPAYWSPTGADRVEFHLSANVGELARPLQRVASGGELSRLMLTLRTISRNGAKLQVEPSLKTALVFDEIDTGIGGHVAEAVGRRLKSLAASQQVLCVTHQPQIARFADHHYAIAKHVEEGRTLTRITELAHRERVTEIARMLGVSQEVATARETAQWLLETARENALDVNTKASGRTKRKKKDSV